MLRIVSKSITNAKRPAHQLALGIILAALSAACGGSPTETPPATPVVSVTQMVPATQTVPATQVAPVTEIVQATDVGPAESTSTSTPKAKPAPSATSQPTIVPTSTPTVGKITGLVKTSQGNPAQGMKVQLTDLPSFTTTSNADGSYTLTDVPPGQHTLMASSSGWISTELSIFVRANETTLQEIRVFIHSIDPTATPTLNPPLAAGPWTGTWILNFGTMNLNQTGVEVGGTYHNAFANADGTVKGTVSGNVLEGTWSIFGGSGSIHWVLSQAGNTFDGNWNGSRQWCGARTGVNFPAGCSFAGAWTNSVAGNSNCAMNLTRRDNSVTGTYCNGSVSGTVSYTGNAEETILTGTWTTGGSGKFTFYLLGYNATQFQGNWESVNYWCGWQSNAVMLSSCLR